MPTRKILGVAFAAAWFLCTPAWPQEARSTVVGRVIDASGGVISGAVLEATNTDTGVRTVRLRTPPAISCSHTSLRGRTP